MVEYAPDLVNYMAANYTRYDDILYIRNDYFETASAILNEENDLLINNSIGEIEELEQAYNGETYNQYFELEDCELSMIKFYTSTFGRVNDSSIMIELYNEDELLFEAEMDSKNMTDGAFETVYFYDSLYCEKGQYNLVLTVQNVETDLSDAVAFAKTYENVNDTTLRVKL